VLSTVHRLHFVTYGTSSLVNSSEAEIVAQIGCR
jgi:hypothetical protein